MFQCKVLVTSNMKIISNIEKSSSPTIIRLTKPTTNRLENFDLRFGRSRKYNIMQIADVNTSTKSTKRSNDNCIIFLFYYPSYLFSVCGIYFTRYVEYFTTFFNHRLNHLVKNLTMFLNKLEHH